MPTELELFAVCLPGLEPLLLGELQTLGAKEPSPEPGGVSFRGGLETLYRANLELGLASQVLLRLASFGARSLADLHRRSARLPWSRWLEAGQPVAIKASCRRSRLYHSGAVAERVLKGLQESIGSPSHPSHGEGEGDGLLLRVRVVDNRCSISLDSSGSPLYRRGWRLQSTRAPLRPDLARALLLVSGWNRKSPLLDPMMGAGTLAIEAACLARGLAPGRLRSFALEQTAHWDENLMARLRLEAKGRSRSDLPFPIFGSDREADCLEAARANAERAGVLQDLVLEAAPLSKAAYLRGEPVAPAQGALVTNPPYGHRLGDAKGLRHLYQSLGHAYGKLPKSWSLALLASDRRLALRTGLPLETAFLADSGGLKVRALVLEGRDS